MRTVFVDTSFYVAFCNPRDALHEAAVELSSRFHGRMLTTEYVLVELGNWLGTSGDRAVFVELLNQLRADPLASIVPASQDLFDRGVGLYWARSDKEWSLTDCISFVVMEKQGLSDAFTSGHHFEQAGFTALLKQ